MIAKLTLAAVVLVALAGSTFAREVDMPVAVDKAAFKATKAHLTEQLDSDSYSEITQKDKQAVLAALDRIDFRLDRAATPDKLSDQDRVDTFNDQEIINTITSHAAADSRMYCERDALTGSHRVKLVCLTMATWMEREKTGQTSMSRIEHDHNSTCSVCSK